jgi:hypothetical protein
MLAVTAAVPLSEVPVEVDPLTLLAVMLLHSLDQVGAAGV